MNIRRANERGHADHGWLRTFHTFSFADYYDPANMGFRTLRVINEDYVHPGKGFGTHPHRDMEIVTYVLEGALEHKDSMGNGSVIRPGDVQRMSAGTGVTHSEVNGSKNELVHLLQIWIVPDRRNYPPSYEQKNFSVDEKRDQLLLVASADGRDGSVTIHQDARLFASVISTQQRIEYVNPAGRNVWLHVARGAVDINGQSLAAGDAASFEEPGKIAVTGSAEAEILLFDLN